MILVIQPEIIYQTVDKLQQAGKNSKEFLVYWLGIRLLDRIEVMEVYSPLQKNTDISIRISETGIRKLFDKIKRKKLVIAAQIHSHPMEAYHSLSDDRLALPRHEGGISIVLPNFCQKTSYETFFEDAACFRLSSTDIWEEVKINDFIRLKKKDGNYRSRRE